MGITLPFFGNYGWCIIWLFFDSASQSRYISGSYQKIYPVLTSSILLLFNCLYTTEHVQDQRSAIKIDNNNIRTIVVVVVVVVVVVEVVVVVVEVVVVVVVVE